MRPDRYSPGMMNDWFSMNGRLRPLRTTLPGGRPPAAWWLAEARRGTRTCGSPRRAPSGVTLPVRAREGRP